MATAAVQTRWRPEDLLAMRDEGRFELIDGELVERQMGAESSYAATRLVRFLGNYSDSKNAGLVFQSDCGFQIFERAPDRVRYADGSFIRKGRLPGDRPPKGHCRVTPNIVIEAVSPNDAAREVDEKVDEWLSAGVQLVWVLFPDTRHVLVHRKAGTITKLLPKDYLRGEKVLPGFKCRVAEIFKGL